MKNRDKYPTFIALKRAFNNFCVYKHLCNEEIDCKRGFGYSPPAVACILCFEMWKDSDTEVEEAETKARFVAEEARQNAMDTFLLKYPYLHFDPGKNLDPRLELNNYVWPTVRLGTILDRMNIVTLGDFMELTRERLSEQKGVGESILKSFDKAKDSLARYKADLEKGVWAKPQESV